jgi:hypothetical protein
MTRTYKLNCNDCLFTQKVVGVQASLDVAKSHENEFNTGHFVDTIRIDSSDTELQADAVSSSSETPSNTDSRNESEEGISADDD